VIRETLHSHSWRIGKSRVHSGPRLPAIASIGLGILGFYLLVAAFAPWLAPYDPASFLGIPLDPPSPAHWLGVNDVGQDILSELIYGTRISLAVGCLAALLTLSLATLVGTLAGYLGGWVDTLLMRIVDILMIIPRLPLMIVIAAYAGANIQTTILVIGLLSWPHTARVIRAQVLSLRSRTHIQAARLFGGGALYVIRRHLVPEVGPILAAGFVAQAGQAVMMEAGLAFLGLGDPTLKSWGLIIRYALNSSGFFFSDRWLWWLLPAGLNLSLLLLSFTFLGIGIETISHPRARRHGNAA
jgi:peptide/nickel transport system permease protein